MTVQNSIYQLISSIKNQRIKNLIALQKGRERKIQEKFIIEGIREISLAQQSGFSISTLFICPELFKPDESYPVVFSQSEVIEIDHGVYQHVAYRESTGGIVAEAVAKDLSLQKLVLNENPLVLILESIEKPGNIGAMLRTADAAGFDAVILSEAITDVFNPNVIRSSIGTIFTLNIAMASNSEALAWLNANRITTLATSLEATDPYYRVNFKEASAIVMGSEASGISPFWQKNATRKIVVPMYGKIDSLNVSNTAAIVMFEAIKQRKMG